MVQIIELDSLRLWKLFVLRFGKQIGHRSIKHKRVLFEDSAVWTTAWIRHITPPSFNWVTFLTLIEINCSRTDLIQLSRLTNLGVLTIGRLSGGDPVFEATLVRAWGRAASEAGAFIALRILVCRLPQLVTEQIFTYLNDFPALGVLAVDEYKNPPSFRACAKQNGWSFSGNLGLRIYRYEAEAKASAACTWQHVYNSCFDDGIFDCTKLDHECGDVDDATPILELKSGPAESVRLQNVPASAGTHLFARKSRCKRNEPIPSMIPPDFTHKRSSYDSLETRTSNPRKRIVRTSRQQYVGDFLSSFGT
ncbi:MAG: hypothetical protein Q9207_000317 [Kuettlingeria erythrocarpa]